MHMRMEASTFFTLTIILNLCSIFAIDRVIFEIYKRIAKSCAYLKCKSCSKQNEDRYYSCQDMAHIVWVMIPC